MDRRMAVRYRSIHCLPKIDKQQGGGWIFCLFSIFLFIILLLFRRLTHARKKRKEGRWKNEMEVNSKSNCFLFFILPPFFIWLLSSLPFLHSLFLGSFKMLHFLHIVFKLLSLSFFFYFSFKRFRLFQLVFFISFFLYFLFRLFCRPPLILLYHCAIDFLTHPLPLRFGVVRYIYILKEL